MKNYEKTNAKNYSKILGIDDKLINKFYLVKFNDSKIENEFNELIINKNFYLKFFIHLVFFSMILTRVFSSKVKSILLIQNSNIIFLTIIFILEIFYYFIKQQIFKKIIDMVISSFYVLMTTFNLIFEIILMDKNLSIPELRNIYAMISTSIIEIFLSVEYNFFLCFSFFILNISVFIFFKFEETNIKKKVKFYCF